MTASSIHPAAQVRQAVVGNEVGFCLGQVVERHAPQDRDEPLAAALHDAVGGLLPLGLHPFQRFQAAMPGDQLAGALVHDRWGNKAEPLDAFQEGAEVVFPGVALPLFDLTQGVTTQLSAVSFQFLVVSSWSLVFWLLTLDCRFGQKTDH